MLQQHHLNKKPPQQTTYHFPIELDEKLMNEGAQYLVGKHDFKSFKASGTSSNSSVRTIYDIKVWRENERVMIEITGNGFLYNMVRIIAGTVVAVGLRENRCKRNTKYNRKSSKNTQSYSRNKRTYYKSNKKRSIKKSYNYTRTKKTLK